MKWLICYVVLAFVTPNISGHTLHWGRTCPGVQPFPNLDIGKILGTWYVLYKTDTDNTCLVWNVTRGELPDTLEVTETRQLSVLDAFKVDHTHAVTARVDIPNPEVPAKMRIRWPTSITGKADFIVFDTDYEKYWAVFECDRAGFLHRRSTSILSKTQDIDKELVERVRRLLTTYDATDNSLSEISHDSCRLSGHHNWHINEELFAFVPGVDRDAVQGTKIGEVQDYDATQLEIVGDKVSDESSFRGSLHEASPTV